MLSFAPLVVLVLHHITCASAYTDAYAPGVGLPNDVQFGTNQTMDTNDIYAVIFDAGSTGSRMHVYIFRQDEGEKVELIDEIFEEVKPGLSKYSTDPEKGAESLVSMLNRAEKAVPESVQPVTPLMLMATAGLRQLPDGSAESLLNEVRTLFEQTRFKLVEDSVQILEGVSEGIFSWVTVNYLEGAFNRGSDTVAALDLGGGSTQITFVPESEESFESIPDNMLHEVSLFGKTYTLYTHSYLGLGLMSARLSAMGGKDGTTSDEDVLLSSCLPPDHDVNWMHHSGTNFKLKGMPESGYSSCYTSVKPVAVTQVTPIPELKSRKIYAFSYFFDRAVKARLIDPKAGGTIKVKDYQETANKACDNQSKDDPFFCIDVTYIFSLLRDGYQLDQDTELHITKKINKIEVSWSLGAAFQILSSLGRIS